MLLHFLWLAAGVEILIWGRPVVNFRAFWRRGSQGPERNAWQEWWGQIEKTALSFLCPPSATLGVLWESVLWLPLASDGQAHLCYRPFVSQRSSHSACPILGISNVSRNWKTRKYLKEPQQDWWEIWKSSILGAKKEHMKICLLDFLFIATDWKPGYHR